jgi:hypothetical protein
MKVFRKEGRFEKTKHRKKRLTKSTKGHEKSSRVTESIDQTPQLTQLPCFKEAGFPQSLKY